VAITVEQVHRLAEGRGPLGDLPHDRLEAGVVGERGIGHGRVEHVGLGEQDHGSLLVLRGLVEDPVDQAQDDRGALLDLGELLRGGDIGYELSLDPRTPIVIGLYPMRPVVRS